MDAAAAITGALAANGRGDEDEALARYGPALRLAKTNARAWQALGLLARSAERSAEAVDAFTRAAQLAPHDALIVNGLAQVRLEAGLEAVTEFENAVRLLPNAQAIQGLSAALVASGRRMEARALLARALTRQPTWGEGHWLLVRLGWQGGERQPEMPSLDQALSADPRNAALWQTKIAIQQRCLAFAPLLETITDARRQLGESLALDAAEAAALSELGEVAVAETRFARLPSPASVTERVYQLRHMLRVGRPHEAGEIAEQAARHAHGEHFWPYAAIAWRLTGDPRYQWLEGDASLVGIYDLADELASLPMLAERLRKLHTCSIEPLEQSVRAGTQTDGPLFARLEPEIQDLRNVIVATVQQHVAKLELYDPDHPQLGPDRKGAIRFAGAWSVRLTGGGHHVGHVHPEGWFSSAFYAALPAEQDRGKEPAGWLELGMPDEALGVSLPPLVRIEPKPGRLILFPSTMWHGVHAFAEGERISVAFDVKRPRARLGN